MTAARADATPMQRFSASACRGTVLTRSDLGRLHSSAAGVAEPEPDASYVADALARGNWAGSDCDGPGDSDSEAGGTVQPRDGELS